MIAAQLCIRARLSAVPQRRSKELGFSPCACRDVLSGAKAQVLQRPCSARLKSCPDTKRSLERLRDLNNLALLLQATNRLAEAEPLMRRALEIFEKSLGPEHPDTI